MQGTRSNWIFMNAFRRFISLRRFFLCIENVFVRPENRNFHSETGAELVEMKFMFLGNGKITQKNVNQVLR